MTAKYSEKIGVKYPSSMAFALVLSILKHRLSIMISCIPHSPKILYKIELRTMIFIIEWIEICQVLVS